LHLSCLHLYIFTYHTLFLFRLFYLNSSLFKLLLKTRFSLAQRINLVLKQFLLVFKMFKLLIVLILLVLVLKNLVLEVLVLSFFDKEVVLELMNFIFLLAEYQLVIVDMLFQSLQPRFYLVLVTWILLQLFNPLLHLLYSWSLHFAILSQLCNFNGLLMKSRQFLTLFQETYLLQHFHIVCSLTLASLYHHITKILLFIIHSFVAVITWWCLSK